MCATRGAALRSLWKVWRSLLATSFDTVVMVSDAASLCETAARLTPELALVDLSLATGELACLVEELRRRCPGL